MNNFILKKSFNLQSFDSYLIAAKETNQFTNYGMAVQFLEEEARRMLKIEDSKAVIAAAHVLYREKNSFGMPSNGGIVVEEAFLAVNHWILTRMSSNYQRICPLPSTFVIRHLWLKFCVTEAPPLRSEAGFTDKEPLSSAEILAITMSTDLEIFTNFVCQLMEHQALLELFAFQMAQFD
jgi:hypothetical protein